MRNVLILTIFFSFSTIISAQNEAPERKTSFGIDLILPIVTLSGEVVNSPDIELQLQRHFGRSAVRLRGVISTKNRQSTLISTIVLDSLDIRQNYSIQDQFGVFLGGQYQITKGRFPFYTGIDAGYRWEKGSVITDGCQYGATTSPCTEFYELRSTSRSYEFTLFVGIRFDLNPRFFINIETGPEFIFKRGSRRFWTNNTTIESQNIDADIVNAGTLLRDISLNFRF